VAVNEQQQASYVFAQAVAAMAEIESMKAANWMREMQGHTIAYGEEEFLDVIEKYQISNNAILAMFAAG
jgi:hypothetical protein